MSPHFRTLVMFVPASTPSVYEKQDQCGHWSPSNWDKRSPSPRFGVLGRSSVTAGLKGGCRVPGVSRHPLRVCCEAEGGLGALAGHAVFLSGFRVLRGLRQSSTRAGPVWSLVLPWGLWHLPG